MANPIVYVKRKDIDDSRWNLCIESAENGLIYAYSYYLDHMARNWDALIFGDYQLVMPIVWNKKYGIAYMYQPAFTPVLGIFGNGITQGIIHDFLAAVPHRFKVIEIALNYRNKLGADMINTIVCNNFVLNLNRNYEQIASGYRENIRRNVKKALQYDVEFRLGINVSEVLELSKQQMTPVSNVSEHDYSQLKSLYSVLKGKSSAESYGVYSLKGQLLSSCIFFFSHRRAYYIVVGNDPDSRAYGASHFLIDQFISLHAGREILLDFEGSDIKNLAFFYESFGANVEVYPAIRINRLPGILKWLRK